MSLFPLKVIKSCTNCISLYIEYARPPSFKTASILSISSIYSAFGPKILKFKLCLLILCFLYTRTVLGQLAVFPLLLSRYTPSHLFQSLTFSGAIPIVKTSTFSGGWWERNCCSQTPKPGERGPYWRIPQLPSQSHILDCFLLYVACLLNCLNMKCYVERRAFKEAQMQCSAVKSNAIDSYTPTSTFGMQHPAAFKLLCLITT